MRHRHFSRRRARNAFTFIEILTVIAIIGLLGTIVLAIAPLVENKKRSSVTTASIRYMSAILENFKTTYGAYPVHDGGTGDSVGWQRNLYACITGLKVLKNEDNTLRLLRYDAVTSSDTKTPQRLPFASESTFEVVRINGTVPPNEDERYFVDGWGNPFAYRFNIISGGKLGTQWERPGFLLISAGKNFREPLADNDIFSGNMESTGKVPDEYFSDSYRADNITNWNQD
ncbi:MAG: type II secretion system GspH family protein [Puniceicoccales bacterium]|nr:type II secretion system GspH family protein [Puniceicoccales bacterium]